MEAGPERTAHREEAPPVGEGLVIGLADRDLACEHVRQRAHTVRPDEVTQRLGMLSHQPRDNGSLPGAGRTGQQHETALWIDLVTSYELSQPRPGNKSRQLGVTPDRSFEKLSSWFIDARHKTTMSSPAGPHS